MSILSSLSSQNYASPQLALTELVNQVATRAPAEPRVAAVVEQIQNELHQNLTVAELADSVSLSGARLCTLFKEVTGVPPGRYLKLLRLQRAAELLATEGLITKVVQARVGIGDASHFVRDFKDVYGLTPARYRTCLRCQEPGSDAVLHKANWTAPFAAGLGRAC